MNVTTNLMILNYLKTLKFKNKLKNHYKNLDKISRILLKKKDYWTVFLWLLKIFL